jgi:hypothetical protein
MILERHALCYCQARIWFIMSIKTTLSQANGIIFCYLCKIKCQVRLGCYARIGFQGECNVCYECVFQINFRFEMLLGLISIFCRLFSRLFL